MGWELSSWLGLVRCVQILTTLAASSINAFLVGYISVNRLGLAQNMIVLQSMMTANLFFVGLAFAIVHTGKRSTHTQWLVAGIVGDVIFTGMQLACITLLSQAGVPQHCAGLTRWNYTHEDATHEPKEGYTSIRFTNGWGGSKGELDKYCAGERGFYVISIALVFTFMLSVILAVLRICEGAYTRNSKVEHFVQGLRTIHDEEKLKLGAVSPPPRSEPQTPPMVSTHTQAAVPHHHLQHHQQHHHSNEHATAPQQQQQLNVITQNPNIGSSGSVVGPSQASPRAAMPQHFQQQSQSQYRPPLSPTGSSLYSAGVPTTTAAIASSSSSSAFFSQPHLQQQQQPSLGMPTFGYNTTPEENAAVAALITDGASQPGLPPYTPGRLHPMAGHGDESNEIRLSEYVKGETRAQNMKDGGGGL